MRRMICKIPDSFIETRIDDELVLVQVDRGTFHSLKTSGLAIWDLIDGTRDKSAIVEALAREFDVAREQCDAEVQRFLDQLHKAGLIALG